MARAELPVDHGPPGAVNVRVRPVLENLPHVYSRRMTCSVAQATAMH
jgi:hypothetical protein